MDKMPSIKGRYAKIEISLENEENDKELFLVGDYISILSVTGEGTCKIKLDHRHSQELDFREIASISGIFERVYFSSDGLGGTCTLFIGDGYAIHITPDPKKLWNGIAASGQGETLNDAVGALASHPTKLKDVSILNCDGAYGCYIGPYIDDPATFRANGYLLLPHKTVRFSTVEMYSMGAISYDGVHNVTIHVIGIYD